MWTQTHLRRKVPHNEHCPGFTLGKALGRSSGELLKVNFTFIGDIYILHQECTVYFSHGDKFKLLHLVCFTFSPLIPLPLWGAAPCSHPANVPCGLGSEGHTQLVWPRLARLS